jgi:hypothetical protein
MTFSVWRQSSKVWVRPLVIPYIATFCVAAITSVGTIGYKCRMVLTKLCKRSSESTDWHVDVAHDRASRRELIGKLAAHEQSYNTMESQSIASGVALIEIFSSSLSSEAGSQAHWKLDVNSNRLIGYTEGIVRGASPEDVIAYLMDIESRFVQADQNRDVTVRFEVLQKVNDHHNAVFTEIKTAPFTNRTFVNSLICNVGQRVQDGVCLLARPPRQLSDMGDPPNSDACPVQSVLPVLPCIAQGRASLCKCCWEAVKT